MIQSSFDWQGHRGARGLAPENTVPAFLKALEFPAITTLELDVVISRDSEVIVSHDPWVSPHICDCPKKGAPPNIFQLSYDEIRQYDCGSRKNRNYPKQLPETAFKPTLREVVHEVDRYCQINERAKPRFNIEIKARPDWDDRFTPAPGAFARLVLGEVISLGIRDRVYLQSFDPRILRELQRLEPGIVLSFLTELPVNPDKVVAELGFTPQIICPYYKLVTRKLIQTFHQRGMQIIPWTVNSRRTMERLRTWGVDGIITDYPDRIPFTYIL